MKNLLLKEFKLCILPINYIFLTFAVILIIPNYFRYFPILILIFLIIVISRQLFSNFKEYTVKAQEKSPLMSPLNIKGLAFLRL
jgi:hypothetical protein